MRYRLSPNGSFSKQLQRLLRSINEDIALAMLRAGRDPEAGIHEARKRCKEIRALLRLVGTQLGDEEYQQRQAFYKSVAARLSVDRDALVREKTWANLVAEGPSLQSSTYGVVAQLLSNPQMMSLTGPKQHNFFVELALEVEYESDAPNHWDLPRSLSDLIPNLKRVYKNAREAEQKAKHSNNVEDFHRFRKRSKDLFYSLRVLRPLFGQGLKEYVDELKALTELQGLANDHAVLMTYLSENRQAIDLDNAGWEVIQASISSKLEEFQKRSHKAAKKLFAESPGSFIKTL